MDDDISPITVDRDDEDVLVSLWHPSLDERLRALQVHVQHAKACHLMPILDNCGILRVP